MRRTSGDDHRAHYMEERAAEEAEDENARGTDLDFLSPSSSALYGIKFQCRCIATRLAECDRHQFIVGSASLKDENEIHVLEYNEENNQIQCVAVMNHPNEVWDLKSCPFDKNLLLTCHSTGFERDFSLWKIAVDRAESNGATKADEGEKTDAAESSDSTMVELITFPRCKDSVRSVLWEPTTADTAPTNSRMVSIHQNSIQLWSLSRGSAEGGSWSEKRASNSERTDNPRTTTGCWDPIHPNTVATACGTSILTWDLRTMKTAQHLKNAHRLCVRDIDYNANKPWTLLTSGEDGAMKFWDLRHSRDPLKALDAHRHWITSSKFNPNHDQLVLSASTDHTVKLWRMSSVSSSPLTADEESDDASGASPQSRKDRDGLVKCFDEHEDSVYSIAWSACEPWFFASLSYDGRVVIGGVPSTEKYKILLN